MPLFPNMSQFDVAKKTFDVNIVITSLINVGCLKDLHHYLFIISVNKSMETMVWLSMNMCPRVNASQESMNKSLSLVSLAIYTIY